MEVDAGERQRHLADAHAGGCVVGQERHGVGVLVPPLPQRARLEAMAAEGGTLVMRAERVGADTLLSQIVHMVAQAQRTRAPVQRLADLVAAWFVQAVVAIAVVTASFITPRWLPWRFADEG